MKWDKININDYTDNDYEKWYSLMSESKKIRVDSIRFEEDKKRTVFAEMLARKMLAQMCSVNEQDIIFDIHKSGKPFAVGLDVDFNVSHSDDMVVCAVSDKAVGIDVEKIRPVDLKIAKRICSDDELFYIFGHKPPKEDFVYTTDTQVLTRFFELWCAKEAYVKCSGKGLSCGLLHTPQKNSIITDGYIISICEK